jgi:hypothetical protein
VVDLLLHGREIRTVFDLLGSAENDLTYSLGWALARSKRLAGSLLKDVFVGADPGELVAVRLQEFVRGGGFTDIELESERLGLIIEAKRGWNLPGEDQLSQYAPRLNVTAGDALLVLAEASPDYAKPLLPSHVSNVPVLYRSWKQIAGLVDTSAHEAGHAEKRLLRELDAYLKGLMTMQNQTSNLVYVVSLAAKPTAWSGSLTPIQIVAERGCYFHEIGRTYPSEPPNYLGFRWDGQLQQIRHVEGYEVITDPHPHFPEIPTQAWERTYLYSLGPPIMPPTPVRTGRLFRVWAMLDLLLTCETIAEARDLTQARLAATGV